MSDYKFPVQLETILTTDGKPVKGMKAVVRQDNREPLSVVSDRYKLITHSEVATEAMKFGEALGMRGDEVSHSLNASGSVFLMTFECRREKVGLDVGDAVSLKLFVANSYNMARSVFCKLGAEVLSCKNGMVASKMLGGFSVRHVGGNNTQFSFPHPENVHEAFRVQAGMWNRLSGTGVNVSEALEWMKEDHILSNAGLAHIEQQAGSIKTVWDLYQGITNFVTHQTQRLSEIGRFNQLSRIDRWISSTLLP